MVMSVRTNSTVTITTGMTVQTISSLRLPRVCDAWSALRLR